MRPDADSARGPGGLPPPGKHYSLIVFLSAIGLLVCSLAAFNYALSYNVGPLEGLALDAEGNLRPEPPIRVALVAGVSPYTEEVARERAGLETTAPKTTGPADPERERARWREALAAPSITVFSVDPDAIPADRSQADVVVLPWGTRLEPAQLERLGGFVASGGGALAAGKLSSEDLTPAPDGKRVLTEEALFQVAWHALPPETVGPLEVSPFAHELVSGPIPPGYKLLTNLEALRPTGLARAAHPVAAWRDGKARCIAFKEPAAGNADAIALGAWGAGRTAWLGFPISQVYQDRDAAGIVQSMIMTLVRWLVQRPVVHLELWPGPPPPPISLAVSVEDEASALELAKQLEDRHLVATWFLPGPLVDRAPALVARLARAGEVAIRGPRFLSRLSLADQRNRLLELTTPLRRHLHQEGPGYLASEGGDRELRDALRSAGIEYLFPGGADGRLVPRWDRPQAPAKLMILPAPRLDLSALEVPPEELKLNPLERLWLHAPPTASKDWSIIQLSSRSVQGARVSQNPTPLLDKLTRDVYRVETLGAMADTWRTWSSIDVFSQRLREDRVHVRVRGGEKTLFQVRALLYLPDHARVVQVVSHHLRPARVRVTPLRDGVVELEFDRLEADRIQDFFLELGSIARSASARR